MALMTGDKLVADFVAESRCQALFIPVSLFQSEIMADPRAVQFISRSIAERFRLLSAEPSKATAALQKSDDPYGLCLKSERPEKILVVNCGSSSLKYTFFDTTDPARDARGQVSGSASTAPGTSTTGRRGEMAGELPKGGLEAFRAMAKSDLEGGGSHQSPAELTVVVHRVVRMAASASPRPPSSPTPSSSSSRPSHRLPLSTTP